MKCVLFARTRILRYIDKRFFTLIETQMRCLSLLINDASSSEFSRIAHPRRAKTKTYTTLLRNATTATEKIRRKITITIRVRRKHSCLIFSLFLFLTRTWSAMCFGADATMSATSRHPGQWRGCLATSESTNKLRDHWQPSLFSVQFRRSDLSFLRRIIKSGSSYRYAALEKMSSKAEKKKIAATYRVNEPMDNLKIRCRVTQVFRPLHIDIKPQYMCINSTHYIKIKPTEIQYAYF